jgi:hypothetical protein
MGWGREARRVRDATLPVGHRFRALQVLVSEHHHPLGYHGTLDELERVAGVRRILPGRRLGWTDEALRAALDELERSRATHVAYREAFARRRAAEKAAGQRVPTAGDAAALRRREWLRDPAVASERHPSVRDRRRSSPGAPTRP